MFLPTSRALLTSNYETLNPYVRSSLNATFQRIVVGISKARYLILATLVPDSPRSLKANNSTMGVVSIYSQLLKTLRYPHERAL